MPDEFNSNFGYFCLEADFNGCWSQNRDSIERKFGRSNRVMVSIVHFAKAKMYFLDKTFVLAFITDVLTMSQMTKSLEEFHHRSRVRARLRWSNLRIDGFNGSGHADEWNLHSQQEELAECIGKFAQHCEQMQIETKFI